MTCITCRLRGDVRTHDHAGLGHPCFLIAEAGVNHNGNPDIARRLVDVAVKAGADAVKFQTFIPEKVMSVHAPKAAYQERNTGGGESQLDMVKKLQLPFEAFRDLADYCKQQGILFLSTPFDFESIDFLSGLAIPCFKIPSGEITNFPFLEHVARKGTPIILSTGMSTLAEVAEALDVLRHAGNKDIALLHCVSVYPASSGDTNLRAMATMQREFGLQVGLSDHSSGIEISLAAVAMGASIIEKHFTLSQDMEGPDHKASLNPEELVELVKGIRKVESALGDGIKRPAASELDTATVARRSLVAARDISAGTILTDDLIALKRPGTGLPPKDLKNVIGRRTKVRIAVDEVISLSMLT